MKHFPGRTVAEITSLAADIVKNKGSNNTAAAYVDNCMLPAAEQALNDGEDPSELFTMGYSLSTVTATAEKIAGQLDRFGFVDIS